MKITMNNFDDGRRYYHDTYIFCDNELVGNKAGWYYVSLETCPYVVLTNVNTETQWMHDVKAGVGGVTLEYTLPGKTLYTTADGRILILARKLDKQYKRGLSPDNSYCLLMNLHGGNWTNQPFKKSMASLLHFCKENTNQEVTKTDWDKLSKGDIVGLVLSPYVSIHRSGSLFLYETRVGYVDFKHNVVFCNPLFHEEVSQCLPNYVRLGNTSKRNRVGKELVYG